jgi:hypothetical protein
LILNQPEGYDDGNFGSGLAVGGNVAAANSYVGLFSTKVPAQRTNFHKFLKINKEILGHLYNILLFESYLLCVFF